MKTLKTVAFPPPPKLQDSQLPLPSPTPLPFSFFTASPWLWTPTQTAGEKAKICRPWKAHNAGHCVSGSHEHSGNRWAADYIRISSNFFLIIRLSILEKRARSWRGKCSRSRGHGGNTDTFYGINILILQGIGGHLWTCIDADTFSQNGCNEEKGDQHLLICYQVFLIMCCFCRQPFCVKNV